MFRLAAERFGVLEKEHEGRHDNFEAHPDINHKPQLAESPIVGLCLKYDDRDERSDGARQQPRDGEVLDGCDGEQRPRVWRARGLPNFGGGGPVGRRAASKAQQWRWTNHSHK